jgi:aminoglycoside phosphotransferase (APT) family kinase protein
VNAEEIARGVAEPLAAALGIASVAIADVRRVTGGSIHETWSFVAKPAGEEPRRLILRAFLPFGPQGMTARQEYAVLRAAADAGVSAPRPLALLEAGLTYPSYVMEYVDGETIGRRIIKEPSLAAGREVLPEQMGATLARIHAVAVDADLREMLRGPAAGVSPVDAELQQLEAGYRAVTPDPHPAFELALRWLAQHKPEAGAPRLVHGDFRVGNFVVGPEGLRSVLDWEGAHLGDPAEDLAWVCVRSWRFGAVHLPAGGVGTREALLRAYERAGGEPISLERLRWWEVYGNARWGQIILSIVEPFLNGTTHDVEPGAIGRRFAETEMELLDLIDGD